MAALAVITRPSDQVSDDTDLVAAVRAGDDRAFEILFERYQGRIAAYVCGMVRDHGRSEDITQEVFISALRRMRETDREITFKPWIYEIAKNACIDAFRRSRRTNEVSFDAQNAVGSDDHDRLAAPGLTPEDAVEGKVAFDNLRGALGGLSQTHHDILVMREFEGLSYRVIGERLGMSGPAVESTLFRARRRLSEEYEELASGERCLRVQRIVEAGPGEAVGVRDQRRMARHLSHCQPCRRYAGLAGFDLDVARRPSIAARIAAFLPLPEFLRRKGVPDEAGALLGHQATAPVAQWSASIASVLDPATVTGWSKAIATAATVAVAGVGAGSAITDRNPLDTFSVPAPEFLGAPAVPAMDAGSLPTFLLPGVEDRGEFESAPPDAGGATSMDAGAATGSVAGGGASQGTAGKTTGVATAPHGTTPVPGQLPAAGVGTGLGLGGAVDAPPAKKNPAAASPDAKAPGAGKDEGLFGGADGDGDSGGAWSTSGAGGQASGPISGLLQQLKPGDGGGGGGGAAAQTAPVQSTANGSSGPVSSAVQGILSTIGGGSASGGAGSSTGQTGGAASSAGGAGTASGGVSATNPTAGSGTGGATATNATGGSGAGGATAKKPTAGTGTSKPSGSLVGTVTSLMTGGTRTTFPASPAP